MESASDWLIGWEVGGGHQQRTITGNKCKQKENALLSQLVVRRKNVEYADVIILYPKLDIAPG